MATLVGVTAVRCGLPVTRPELADWISSDALERSLLHWRFSAHLEPPGYLIMPQGGHRIHLHGLECRQVACQRAHQQHG
jgi:hypothetical protein